jgi:hypothetical protein
LSTSTEASVYFDAKSSVETSYSLSDREVLPGTGNLHTDPALVFPSAGNFELAPGSPCIDSGDQSSPDDPDEIWIVRPPLETKPPRFVAPPGGDLRTVYDRDGLDDDARALAALGARVVNSRG